MERLIRCVPFCGLLMWLNIATVTLTLATSKEAKAEK